MISIVHQGDHRYNIYEDGRDIGCIAVSRNPMHDRHCHLNLGLEQYDPEIAGELFSLLGREIGMPLKVMLYTTPELYAFLTAGGFVRKRRCWELELSADDLAAPLRSSMPLAAVQNGSKRYDACCALLYEYYRTTHAPISPLTATLDEFRTHLPDTVLCTTEGPLHCAFLDQNELAYTATADPAAFPDFARALLRELFRQHDYITTECDDCDPCAMTVKSLFRIEEGMSWDTYICAP